MPMPKKKFSIAVALLLLAARAPAADAGRGRHAGPPPPPPTTASAVQKLRGGGQPGPATAAAALATFAEDRPLLAAFLSCAANGLAADCVAQRSEARGRRRPALRTGAAVSAALRTGGGAGMAFVNATSAHTRDGYGRGVPTAPPAAAALSSALVEQTKGPSSEKPVRWDARRSLAFVLYGGCYQGMACHLFYNVLFLQWFGPGRAWTKVAVSQFVLAPLLTLPCAYVFRGIVFGKSARQTLDEYMVGVTQNGLLVSFWKLWIPIQFLIFTVIPMHLRIPFSSFFSFLWTVILSRKTSRS